MLHRMMLTALLFVPASFTLADPEQETPDAPQALEILRQATERIVQSPSFSADMEMSIRVGLPGFEHEKGAVYKLAVARPNRLLVLRTHGDIGATFVSDGKRLTMYVPELRQYVHRDAPATLDELSNSFSAMSLLGQGVGSNFMALLAKDPYARLVEGATSSKVLGIDSIDGMECDHLRLEKETAVLDVWVTRGPMPTIRRLSADYSKQLAGEEDAEGISIVASVELRLWDLAAELDPQAFTYQPPASATLEENFAAIVPAAVMPPIAQPSHHPLLGEAAPEFALVELSGDKAFELKPQLGKQVILLDFWATWCGPCRKGLPEIAKLAKEYANKPVAVYAVNIKEDAETIETFLKDTELDINVLRDVGGEVAKKYQATGIPQTVLIGLDGRVQVIHVGLTSKEKLAGQIDALLNGEDLATKALEAEKAKIEAQTLPASEEENREDAESEDTDPEDANLEEVDKTEPQSETEESETE